MIRVLTSLTCQLFLLPTGLLHAADDGPDESVTPADQYAALLREYRPASAWMRGAQNDEQRKEGVERMGSFAPRFLDLAETYPDDPIALQALRQSIQIALSTDSRAQTTREMNDSNFPRASERELAARTVRVLLRDHLHSEHLVPVCDRIRYAYRMEYADFLRTVLRENPHRDVQGVACISLAQFLNDRLRMLQLTEDRPELTGRFENLFGNDYLPEIVQSVRSEEIETLFVRAAEEYSDVDRVFGGTVGAKAEKELYEIRHLSTGMVAPDIAGVDQDGEQFRLSDYRGKVVLLYFWMEI